MTRENDLFTKKEFDALKARGLDVFATKSVVYYTKIGLDGMVFDAKDMLETLRSIAWGDIAITDKRMADVLKKYGVILSAGSLRGCMPATEGPNYAEFVKMLESKVEGD